MFSKITPFLIGLSLLLPRNAAPQTQSTSVAPPSSSEPVSGTNQGGEPASGANQGGEPVGSEGKTPASAAPAPPAIEEIVVTATKRETALQETAVAVTALLGESLERQQVVDLKSVTALVPNLQIGAHSDSAGVDVSLRGIVSTNRTELGDPAVAFHVNGFYSPRPQGATTLLYDVERIEVLRGPQGTLFGRNANAGVINVVTAQPKHDTTSASIDITAGNYNLARAKGHLNAPVYENLAIRAAMYLENRDGYIAFQDRSRVPAGAPRCDNSDKASFRLGALWEPIPELRVFVSAEQYSDTGLTAETTYYYRVTAVDSSGNESAPSREASATTGRAPSANLRLQYRNADQGQQPEQIKPHVKIVNAGTSQLPLSELTVRYWYSAENLASGVSQVYACDYATRGCGNITARFVKLATAVPGADHYLEIGFTAGAGSVAPGADSGEIQNRFHKSNWSAYDETNDHSYAAPSGSHSDWNRITVYRNGALAWGIEP